LRPSIDILLLSLHDLDGEALTIVNSVIALLNHRTIHDD